MRRSMKTIQFFDDISITDANAIGSLGLQEIF